MKRYRVWQANREVFLWPENWLYPELRDDQSPIFKQTMSALLQSDITDDAAADAYLDYLAGLEAGRQARALRHLLRAGERRQFGRRERRDRLCRRAHRRRHRKYYFRRLQGGAWTPWEEVKIDCEDMPVTPVVWNGRLLLFWLRILKQAAAATPAVGKPSHRAQRRRLDLGLEDRTTCSIHQRAARQRREVDRPGGAVLERVLQRQMAGRRRPPTSTIRPTLEHPRDRDAIALRARSQPHPIVVRPTWNRAVGRTGAGDPSAATDRVAGDPDGRFRAVQHAQPADPARGHSPDLASFAALAAVPIPLRSSDAARSRYLGDRLRRARSRCRATTRRTSSPRPSVDADAAILGFTCSPRYVEPQIGPRTRWDCAVPLRGQAQRVLCHDQRALRSRSTSVDGFGVLSTTPAIVDRARPFRRWCSTTPTAVAGVRARSAPATIRRAASDGSQRLPTRSRTIRVAARQPGDRLVPGHAIGSPAAASATRQREPTGGG